MAGAKLEEICRSKSYIKKGIIKLLSKRVVGGGHTYSISNIEYVEIRENPGLLFGLLGKPKYDVVLHTQRGGLIVDFENDKGMAQRFYSAVDRAMSM